jgi:flagellin
MPISIRSSIASLRAQRNLFQQELALHSSLAKLSSGYRITQAGDDPAGSGVATSLDAQLRSYNQAVRNAQDGLSMAQTAEGALNGQSSILTRLRELSVQSSSSGLSDTDRTNLQTEVASLITEIDRLSDATEFNGQYLLNSVGTALTFQGGIRGVAANDRIVFSTENSDAGTLGVSGLSISSLTSAQAAITTIDTALERVSATRARFGAAGNRMNTAISNLQISAENTASALSRVKDVDVATETSQLTRTQILMQVGASILAQANQIPSIALKLLG